MLAGVLKKAIKNPLNKIGIDVVRYDGSRKERISRLKSLADDDFFQSKAVGDGYQKIFGIGFNKTGTTTLASVLKTCGFFMPDQGEQEVILSRVIDYGDYNKLREFVSQYDAFQDMPFSQGDTYIACDVLFPHSKFVLTVRDPEEWYCSLLNFHKRKFGFKDASEVSEGFFRDKSMYLYENYVYETMVRLLTVVENGCPTVRWDLAYDKDFFIDTYNKRNDDVIKYFRCREDDLLVIDVTKEKTTGRLLDFLNFPSSKEVPMPHKNKT